MLSVVRWCNYTDPTQELVHEMTNRSICDQGWSIFLLLGCFLVIVWLLRGLLFGGVKVAGSGFFFPFSLIYLCRYLPTFQEEPHIIFSRSAKSFNLRLIGYQLRDWMGMRDLKPRKEDERMIDRQRVPYWKPYIKSRGTRRDRYAGLFNNVS